MTVNKPRSVLPANGMFLDGARTVIALNLSRRSKGDGARWRARWKLAEYAVCAGDCEETAEKLAYSRRFRLSSSTVDYIRGGTQLR